MVNWVVSHPPLRRRLSLELRKATKLSQRRLCLLWFRYHFARSAPSPPSKILDRPLGLGEQGWRSGESTCLPPMWPGFDSWSRRRMSVEFVVGSRPCSEGFSSGSPVFLPPQKPTFPNSIWNQWSKSHSVEVPLQIPIYYFIYLFIYVQYLGDSCV